MTLLATPENLRVLDALCRTDFVSFIRKTFHSLAPAQLHMNFYIHALAFYLELVRLGRYYPACYQPSAAVLEVMSRAYVALRWFKRRHH
jgi:hypothetical protein